MALMSYALFLPASEKDQDVMRQLAVVDANTGEIIRSDLWVDIRHFSVHHRDNRIVHGNASGDIIVYDVATGVENTLLTAKQTTTLPWRGDFFPGHAAPAMAIYHTNTASFLSDETFIIAHDTVSSLCLNGSVDTGTGIPSWSEQQLYQFSLLQLSDDLFSEVWVYDANHHRLSVAIARDTIEDYQEMGWRLIVLGWGSSMTHN